jgi:hypothetical protein
VDHDRDTPRTAAGNFLKTIEEQLQRGTLPFA